MASKAKGKGKQSKGKAQSVTNITKDYEGAVDSSYYINAIKQDGQKCEARIIGCRLLKTKGDLKERNQYSYEYYVHFLRHNRRWDEWLTRDKFDLTDQVIQEEPVQKKKKINTQVADGDDEHDSTDEITQFQKTIGYIEIGKFKCETWYYSPLPFGYQNIDCLIFCEFCLSFFLTKTELQRHAKKCKLTHPPGNEVYRDDIGKTSVSMYEVDGAENAQYTENLGYLTKLFLDHKNLYYNLEPFLFFILVENDEYGSHFVGYFSKQKESEQGWNLNCILTLPCYQRKGYGKFLITFSYELSLIEGKLGTPEKPLSDLGKQTYLSWWTQRIVEYIKELPDDNQFTIKDIERETGIKDKDVQYTLEQTGLIKYAQGKVAICTDPNYLDKLYKEAGRPGHRVFPHKIHWVPYHTRQDKQPTIAFKEYDPLNQE